MAVRVVPQLLYGKGHPYSVPLTGTGTEAAVSKMTREDLAKWHETWFKPNNSTLLIVGDTTLAEIKPKLEKLFAGWKPGDVPKKNVTEVPEPPKNIVYLIDRPGSGQSLIFGAELGPPRNDPDAIPLELVNDIFGGNFSSRINMNLREDKHWSYGVRSFMPSARGQRPSEAGERDEPDRRVARHVHRRDRGEEQEALHLRLRQGDVVADREPARNCARRLLAGAYAGFHQVSITRAPPRRSEWPAALVRPPAPARERTEA